jgi:pimeloyl-ACP methyl ester carboxylesterase
MGGPDSSERCARRAAGWIVGGMRTLWTALGLVWGTTAGLWTPRGPLTNSQALWSIGLSVAVGLAAGGLSRSRWAMVLAPAGFVVALELARWGTVPVHLSTFGVLSAVTGRGLHGLLSVLPMALGAVYGAAAGRPTRGGGRWRWVRRAATGVLTLGMLALTAAVAIPARTAPIPGPRSVAELTGVGGLGVMIRGTDISLPVLLFVPGAPGGSETGAVREHLAALEQHFVMATLDRRGGGASYPALDPTRNVTLDGGVADIVAVTEYLRRRFHQEKIYLLAHSGGSIMGVLAAQRRPELFRAYIGTGQAVNLPAGDQIFYTDTLAWARRTGHAGVVRRLADQGPPPYADAYSYEPIMLHENEVYEQSGPGFVVDVPEYTLLQKAHTLNAVLETWAVLYPRMQEADLRTDVPALAVPAYFVQGTEEMRGLAVLFDQWYPALRAPAKNLFVLDGAGHRVIFERPARFTEIMTRVVAETG